MKTLYQYLDRFGFKAPRGVHDRLRNMRLTELREFFDTYVEAVWPEPVIVRHPQSEITVLPDGWGAPPPVQTILQLALYVERSVLHDPILDLMPEWRGLPFHPQYVMRYPDADQRARAFAMQQLEPVLTKLLVLKDLSLEGLVTFAPTALLGGVQELGFLYTTSFFGPERNANDLMSHPHPLARYPEALQRAALGRISVHPVKADLRGNISPQWGKPLSPASTIALAFPDDDKYKLQLLSSASLAPDQDRVIHMKYHPDDAVDENTFLNWIEGSKSDLACDRLDVLTRDLTVASVAQASFLTTFPTSRDLLEITGPTAEDQVLTQLLTLELPYFERVSPSDLVRARKDEAAFQDFRLVLDQALREASKSTDPSADRRAALREVVAAPVARVAAKMRSLQRTIAIDSALLAGTLGVGFYAHEETLLLSAAGLVAAGILRHYRDQMQAVDKVKESRGYFYWDLVRKAKSRRSTQ